MIAEQGEGQERLGEILRRSRAGVSPDCASLGPYLRQPIRIGKPVTQQEVAEAVGISREWYARLENDGSARVSSAVLGRIADALMVHPLERTALFELAVPELRPVSLTTTSTEILDAFRPLRRLTRRLCTASTEAEALALVREYVMTSLAPQAVETGTRLGEGRWEIAATGAPADCAMRGFDLLREQWGPGAIDDVLFHGCMKQPGDLMTLSERDALFPDDAAMIHSVLDAVGLPHLSTAVTSIRSRRGLVARLIAVHTTPHEYSEIERAELSALAELTSLALS
jgi:transcriptional regulator with XRE-family HTH domain